MEGSTTGKHVKIEEENEELHLQAKEHQGLTAASSAQDQSVENIPL